MKEILIPREEAVFRLDAQGRWHNPHGRIEHNKIISYFHASIRWDEDGFFLFQEREDCREKVYFPYVDTALFVFEVEMEGDEIGLVLNTGARIPLDPEDLYVKNDQLYTRHDGLPVKFSEPCLIAISDRLFDDGDGYAIRIGGERHKIPVI